MDAAFIDGDLGVGMVGVGSLDGIDLIHRDGGVLIAEMITHRAGDLAGFIQVKPDLGTMKRRRPIDAEARRTKMRVPPAETESQHTDLAVAIGACLQILDDVLDIEHPLDGIIRFVACLGDFPVRRRAGNGAPEDIGDGNHEPVGGPGI